jgi:hypothetical protein
MKTKYNWTYLCRDSQKDEDGKQYGHSFWRDENSGLISIKDMSGSRPDTTDDGPLWLSTGVPWKIGDRWTNAQVEVERTGKMSVVGIVSEDAPRIAAQLGFRIIIDKKSALGKMLPLIRNLSIE